MTTPQQYPQYPPHYQPQPVPKQKKGRIHWAWLILALFIGIGLGNTGNGGRPSQATAQAPSAPVIQAPAMVQEEATQEALPPGTYSGDNQYIVGVDIQPGTYRSEGTIPGEFKCRISKYADLARQNSNGYINPETGAAIVEITSRDKLVEMEDCQPFKKVS